MKKYIVLFAAVMMLGIQSCNDSFLDRFPETEITKENFFNTAEDLDIYVNGLYDFPGLEIFVNDNSTDNAATTGLTELKNMMIGTPSPATVIDGWDWDRDWSQLRKVNYFLENFGKAQVDDVTKNNYEGLARFFRAK